MLSKDAKTKKGQLIINKPLGGENSGCYLKVIDDDEEATLNGKMLQLTEFEYKP
jgi:hypothetical protein